MTILARTAAL